MRTLHAVTGAVAVLLAAGALSAAFAGEPTNYDYNPPVEYQILGGGERSPSTGFPKMDVSPKNGVDGSHLGQTNTYGKNGVDGSHQSALTSTGHASSAVSSAFSGSAGHAHGMGHGGGGGAK